MGAWRRWRTVVYGNGDSDVMNAERHEQVIELLGCLRERDEEAVGLLKDVVQELTFLRTQLIDLLANKAPKGYVPIETYHATIRAISAAWGIVFMVGMGLQHYLHAAKLPF